MEIQMYTRHNKRHLILIDGFELNQTITLDKKPCLILEFNDEEILDLIYAFSAYYYKKRKLKSMVSDKIKIYHIDGGIELKR